MARPYGEEELESTLQKPALAATKTKVKTIVYWIITALFCL